MKKSQSKQLSKRQLAVIDDLFAGQLDEQAILDKYNVSRNLYNRWLTQDSFNAEFDRRITWAHRQSQILIARYASLAAAKLVELTDSDKEETARRACLDIINLPSQCVQKTEKPDDAEHIDNQQSQQLTPQTASRLLAALAETEQKITTDAENN